MRHPDIVAIPTPPLDFVLVSEADSRGRQRVVLVPLALEDRVGGYRATPTEVAGFALTDRADVVSVGLGGV